MANLPQYIGIVAHPRRPESFPVAAQIAKSLVVRGRNPWLHHQWDNDSRDALAETDVIIAIGGDGAMLRAARTCAPYRVPVLGVNMGYLGFLPEISQPDAWQSYMERLLAGEYWVESRMMLEVLVIRDGHVITRGEALNDVVITRTRPIGTVLLQTYIDQYWTTTYHADALIISTPTGSTGYSLSVGGPILPPELHNILVVPVAAHLSLERPIILSEGASVQVKVSPERDHDVIVVADGVELCEVSTSDTISIRASRNQGLFVRMQDRNYFYRSILDRLEPRVPSRATPNPEHLQIQIREE